MLRAYVGHWRIIAAPPALGETISPGRFLSHLQEALEGRGGSRDHLSVLASEVLQSAPETPELADPPFERWWVNLPSDASAISRGWEVFSLAQSIIRTATEVSIVGHMS